MSDSGIAPRVPTTSTYHGVDVVEDYRWLEDTDAPETVRWTRAQQARTRAHLDAVPFRPALRERVERLLRDDSVRHLALAAGGGRFFVLTDQKPRQRPHLVVRDSLEGGAELTVLDPVALDPSGETAIDWFVPSPGGDRVAVSLSEHGSEDGTLHVYDVASGAEVCEPVPHVNAMGGSTAWRSDGEALWYTLPGDPAGFRQQVWLRDLAAGTDTLDLDGSFADPEIAELPHRRRRLGAGPGAEGRRRRVAAVRAQPGGRQRVVAGRRPRGPLRGGGAGGRRPLRAHAP